MNLPPNNLFRDARLAMPLPTGSGRRMSRQELAEAVNAHVFAATGRVVNLTANYIGKLERGEHRWPCAMYRDAFRAVLGATRDRELGFWNIRRETVAPTPRRLLEQTRVHELAAHLDSVVLLAERRRPMVWAVVNRSVPVTPADSVDAS